MSVVARAVVARAVVTATVVTATTMTATAVMETATTACLVPITPRKGVLHVRYRSIAARITL